MKDIQEAAILLGTDANGVLNELVSAGLPDLLKRARARHEDLLTARTAKDYDLAPINEPILRAMLLAGRAAGEVGRNSAMKEVAKKVYREPYPTPEMLGERAADIDGLLQQLFQLSLMLGNRRGWALEVGEQKQFNAANVRLQGKLKALLDEWERFVYPQGRPEAEGAQSTTSTKKAARGKRTGNEG